MSLLHYLTQRFLISGFILSFVFVSLYTPLPSNTLNTAEAAYPVFDAAAEIQLTTANTNLVTTNAALKAGFGSLIKLETSEESKSLFADGIAWALAKQVVSAITSSIVSWINSGFQGKPVFVQDLGGFLTGIADDTAGLYLQELGGPLSFLCSPFKLDIQIALSFAYARERNGHLYGSCTLTGALSNLESFIDGDFASGGWDAWFSVTSQPELYTPYGSMMAAKEQLDRRVSEKTGEERNLLSFGSGFLSTKKCTSPDDSQGGGPPDCRIVTPGQTISESLSFQLSTGQRSLISADEIDEIIGALIGALAQKAITEGLSSLSGGSGSGSGSSAGSSYLTELQSEAANFDRFREQVLDSIALLELYIDEALFYKPLLLDFANNSNNNSRRREAALAEVNEIDLDLIEADETIEELERLLDQIEFGLTPESAGSISRIYMSLPLHSQNSIDFAIDAWESLIAPDNNDSGSGGSSNSTSTFPGG